MLSPPHARNTKGLTMVDATVSEIADEELLRRAVANCRRGRGWHKTPLWARVGDRFLLGSTFSMQLCRRFGFDPDEQVKS